MIYYAEGNEGTLGVIDKYAFIVKLKVFHSQKKVNNKNMNFWLYLPFTKEVKYKKPICLLSKWKSNVLPKVCPDGVTVLFGKSLGAKLVETHLRPDSFLFNSFTLYSIAVGGRLGEGSIWDFLARLAHGGFGGWWEKRILQKHWNRTFLYTA